MPTTGKTPPRPDPSGGRPDYKPEPHWVPKTRKVMVTVSTWEYSAGWEYNGVFVGPEPATTPPLWFIYLPKSELSVVVLKDAPRAFYFAGQLAKLWRAVRGETGEDVRAALPPWFVPWKDAFLKNTAFPLAPVESFLTSDAYPPSERAPVTTPASPPAAEKPRVMKFGGISA